MPAQEIEQWQERQSENGEIVAVDAGEEVGAEPFETVCALNKQVRAGSCC